MDIIDKVIKESKVSKTELASIRSKIDRFIRKLKSELKNEKAEVVLGGSAAKGTMVKGDFDCDVFVRFEKRDNLSDILEKALRNIGKAERIHGSRDYFQLEHDGLNFEIVPVLLIKNSRDAENVTDMSPLHVAWIEKRIARQPKLRDHIIAAKIFCKAKGVYGAESYISGFSGHVLDILVTYYGSFPALIKNASQWQKYKVIDVESYKSAPLLNESKISPLIVIDPVDKRRNAAAALSMDKFNYFKKAAKEFLDKPSFEHFIEKTLTIDELIKKAGKESLIVIEASPLKGKKDVVGSKLLKVYIHILKHLKLNEFSVLNSGWSWKQGPALIWFIVKHETLSSERTHEGPPTQEEASAKRFRSKHPACFIKDGRLYAKVKRIYRKDTELVRDFLKSEYIKTRTSKIFIRQPENY